MLHWWGKDSMWWTEVVSPPLMMWEAADLNCVRKEPFLLKSLLIYHSFWLNTCTAPSSVWNWFALVLSGGREYSRINEYLNSFLVPVLSISFFWELEMLFQASINPLEAAFTTGQEFLSLLHLFLSRWKPMWSTHQLNDLSKVTPRIHGG